MAASPSIFLIGPMGSGKSAVGKRLARGLGCEFIDSDDEIESRTGVDIAFIFEKEGEAGFRKREREIIEELSRRPGIVLATGGGAVLTPETRTALSARGTVIYLRTSVSQQLRRTRGSRRPLLNKGRRREVLEELMVAREPLYKEVADLEVATDGRSVSSVAAEIQEKLAADR